MIRTDPQSGRGVINILAAAKLMQSPRLYATFLLWLMSELFEELPEIGDPEKPRMVFFFDEAHLLFNDAPKPLLEKIEQVVRLIRSKGVGIYFVTQNPLDVPDIVLGQMGNRVQHALRAFTPRDQKAVKAAADTFRPNPAFSAAEVITQLGVGEALVSTLVDKGVPSIVERTLVRPPSSRIGTISDEERAKVIAASPVGGIYDKAIDRESAFEILSVRVETKVTTETAPPRTDGEAQPGAAGEGRRHPWRPRRHARRRARHQPAARRPADHDPAGRPLGHAHRHHPRRRRHGGRDRQAGRRFDGRFHRPGHRARRAGQHPAELKTGEILRLRLPDGPSRPMFRGESLLVALSLPCAAPAPRLIQRFRGVSQWLSNFPPCLTTMRRCSPTCRRKRSNFTTTSTIRPMSPTATTC